VVFNIFELLFFSHTLYLLNDAQLVFINQKYNKVAQRYEIVPSTGHCKIENEFACEQHGPFKFVTGSLQYMVSFVITEPGNESEVYEFQLRKFRVFLIG